MKDKGENKKRAMTLKKQKAQKLKQIEIPPFVKSVRAGDDFYRFINGNWLKSISISPYRVVHSVSDEVEENIQSKLSKLIEISEEFSKKNKEGNTRKERMMNCIGRFTQSVVQSRHEESVEYLKKVIRSFYCLRDSNEVMSVFGEMNRIGVSTILDISIFQSIKDKKNSYFISVFPGHLGLPDLTYYKGTAPGKTRTLISYINMVRKLSKELNIDDLTHSIQVEGMLATQLQKYRNDSYVDMKGDELKKKFSSIPWDIVFEKYGIAKEIWSKATVRVGSIRWIKYMEQCLKKWPIEAWRDLFTLHTLIDALPILPSPFDDLHFELYAKKLRGQLQKVPQRELVLQLTRKLLFIPLSYLYIEEYINSTIKKEIIHFTKTIQKATLDRIENVKWLEESTKKIAKEKVSGMELGISHPSTIPTVELPDLSLTNALKNVYFLSQMNTLLKIKYLEKGEFTDEIWEEPCYDVNAYYYNEKNKFIIPNGTIQWPFYSEDKKKMGWNYGGLGAIIGHEITHAFDEDGKDYITAGTKKLWWTKKDDYQYKKKTDALIDLYNSAKIQGHSVNGYLTLSENIADLGGLAIALDALQDEIKDLSENEKKQQLRDFFISYAVSWRTKERPRKAIQGLFMDVHAPTELRVNYIVSQFDEWYDIFDVKPEDKLYIAPEKRIRIF